MGKNANKWAYALLSLGFLFLSSCETVQTVLTVGDKPLRVQRDDNMKVRFYQGQYPIQLSMSRGQISMRVNRKEVWTDVTLNVPSGTPIPENGDFNLPGSASGQTFDVSGNIATKREQSETMKGWESCIYYRDEYVCRGRGRDRYCRWERVAATGSQPVEFHFMTTTVDVNATLASPGEGEGKLAIHNVDREKIYTYRGECY